MTWLREAISDEQGRGDAAYVSILVVCVSAILAVTFVLTMTAIDYSVCIHTPAITIGAEESRHIQPCRYDPLPGGQAVGLIFTAFAALIGSLAAYMAANKRALKTT